MTGVLLFGLGLGWNMSFVAATAQLADRSSPAERGKLLGSNDLCASLLGAGLALLGGVVLDVLGVTALAFGAAAHRPPAGLLDLPAQRYGGGRIRTSEGGANGFTARPLWPLGNTPRGREIVATERFDALVVGAGPAGSLAAFWLARGGARVLLTDKARFPRDKPCGGGITVRAERQLPFSIDPVVEDAVDVFELRLGYRRHFRRRTHEPLIRMTQRRRLDAFLVDQAQEAGAEFRDGFRPGDSIRGGGRDRRRRRQRHDWTDRRPRRPSPHRRARGKCRRSTSSGSPGGPGSSSESFPAGTAGSSRRATTSTSAWEGGWGRDLGSENTSLASATSTGSTGRHSRTSVVTGCRSGVRGRRRRVDASPSSVTQPGSSTPSRGTGSTRRP